MPRRPWRAFCLIQRGKRRAQTGRWILQVRVEPGQRMILAGQIPENPHRVAQAGKDLRHKKAFVCQLSQPGGQRQQMPRRLPLSTLDT